MKTYAPIVLFCYNRPELTERTLTGLSENTLAEESELYVYCDGPKVDATEESARRVHDVRAIVRRRQWCKTLHVIERATNRGLANSIIDGVTEVVSKHGSVIVMEDDLLTSIYFLEYMNIALGRYENNHEVMQVSGHQFAIEDRRQSEAGLIPFGTSWGWATWQRAWVLFDPACVGYEKLKNDALLRTKFDLDGNYPFTAMLLQQLEQPGTIDSWAIRWWWKIFSVDGLTVFPCKSLVDNIGYGADATHTHSGVMHESGFNRLSRVTRFPEDVRVDQLLWSGVKAYFRKRAHKEPVKVTWWKRVLGKLRIGLQDEA